VLRQRRAQRGGARRVARAFARHHQVQRGLLVQQRVELPPRVLVVLARRRVLAQRVGHNPRHCCPRRGPGGTRRGTVHGERLGTVAAPVEQQMSQRELRIGRRRVGVLRRLSGQQVPQHRLRLVDIAHLREDVAELVQRVVVIWLQCNGAAQ
jgi:hypothetical protein